MSNQELLDNLEGTEIAVIGMAGRFPGANNIEKYWENLRDGVETIVTYTDDELRAAGVSEKLLQNPNYVKSGAPIDDLEMFDAGFFGFSPRDAAIMDPQHRHFIEISWEALEHAGYDPSRYDGSIGVFGGSGHNIYMPYNLLTNPALMESVGFFLVRHTSNDKDFLVTRVSYLFDLKGPSVNVQTACSTSLVAIHLGVQSLLNRETDIVLAGGVTFELPHHQGYMYEEGEILSPDGHCRAFDADSKGTRFGSGAGVVVLKRLDEAIEDGDTIHAVIKGSAINNDGSNKVNYLAPSVDGQAAAINEALMLANVDPETVTYVETHGTGTPIGDPIEVTALTMAYGAETDQKQFCGIGSVKPNIGHLDTAAGVAGFIKAVQALKHKQIPASLNYSQPNPSIDFENSPFYVNAELQDWKTDGFPRRAGVSSLGVGGTNAHIILEEAPEVEQSDEADGYQLLTLSARTTVALDQMTTNLAEFLHQHPDVNLADVAYTLQLGRKQLSERRVVAAQDVAEAEAVLESGDWKRILSQKAVADDLSVVFMFPGGGAQYPNMGRDLYESEPVYRECIDRCLDLVQTQVDVDLGALMFPDDDGVEEAAQLLQRPSLSLPAIFMTELALAELWLSWGIEPVAMTGHSMGEYTAACLAGVLSVADALSIVTLRGKLFETLPEGGMISVPLPEAEVKPLLIEDLDIAVINSPDSCVVSGRVAAIEKMEAIFEAKEINARRVKIQVAAHSAMLDDILETFDQHLQKIQFNAPERPFISNVSGTWADPQEVVTPTYWVTHLRHTVRFADGVKTLMQEGNRLFLEVGPGQTLSSLTRQHPAKQETHAIVSSLRHRKEAVSDALFIQQALGQLWLAGVNVPWTLLHEESFRHRIPLPTYPFEHQRYWIEPGKQSFDSSVVDIDMSKKEDVQDWFYQPVWQQSVHQLAVDEAAEDAVWVLFTDNVGLTDALTERLNGRTHFTVSMGAQFGQDDNHFALAPNAPADFDKLMSALPQERALKMIYGWALSSENRTLTLDNVQSAQDVNFNALLFLAQAIGSAGNSDPVELIVFSNNAQQIAGEAILHPEQALLAGPVRVIPNEFSHVSSRLVDVAVPQQGSWQERKFYDQLFAEVRGHVADTAVAYRGQTRWVQQFEATPLAKNENRPTLLQPEGVYLITGGFGGIGFVVARHLAKSAQAKLVLLGRSPLPPKGEWADWLATHGPQDKTSQRIRQVQELESYGAEVLPLSADVTNMAEMETAVATITAQFGDVNGVFHTAGLLEDALIQMKTAESSDHVLAAKVQGTLVLDNVLKTETLDFMVLFSSVSAISGIAGQVDYTAANAFLDAYARYKTDRDGTYTVAINWGAWQEVGMTVELIRQMGLIEPEGLPVQYPFIDKWMETEESDQFVAQFSPEKQWILDEHRMRDGKAFLPGASYMELARAALVNKPNQNGAIKEAIEIKDVFFMAPLMVADGDEKRMKIVLSKESPATFEIKSAYHADSDIWQDHVRGSVSWLAASAPNAVNKDEILARCQLRQETYDFYQHSQVNWGPRWNNLRQMNYGTQEALAHLVLPDDFVADLEQFQLHPAMLDLATAGAQDLITGFAAEKTFYVPFSYNRLQMYGALTQEAYSHIRYRQTDDPDTAVFDVTIFDAAGNVLVEIDGFMMRRVEESALGSTPDVAVAATLVTQSVNPLLETVQRGITPTEGVDALDRILATMPATQVVVVSQDLQGLIQQAKQGGETAVAGDTADTGLTFERPNLATPFVAPENELQEKIAAIWQELLGITEVGINDNFFELGGHSLLLTQVVTRVRKLSQAEVSMFSLFDAATVAELAEILDKAAVVEDDAPVEDVPTLGRISRDKYRSTRKAIKIKKKK